MGLNSWEKLLYTTGHTRRITSYNVCYTKLLRKIERDKHFSERRRSMQQAIDQLFTLENFKGIQVVPDVDPYH